MWELYCSRIIRSADARLQQPPFSTSPVQNIVHRHRIRVRQSFKNAVEHCQHNRLRLYVVKAAIAAPVGEEHFLTPVAMKELLNLTSQQHTGFVASICHSILACGFCFIRRIVCASVS